MAEEKKEAADPMKMLWLVVGAMAILAGLWFASGAYKNADVRGLFISPPPPVGPGGSYGPQIGKPNPDFHPENDPPQDY
jgi:hypothetical protein